MHAQEREIKPSEKNFVWPVSRIQFYSLRKLEKWRHSTKPIKCSSHPCFTDTISCEEFCRRGIRPLELIMMTSALEVNDNNTLNQSYKITTFKALREILNTL